MPKTYDWRAAAEARGWITIVSHAAFGPVLGAVYQPLARPVAAT